MTDLAIRVGSHVVSEERRLEQVGAIERPPSRKIVIQIIGDKRSLDRAFKKSAKKQK